MPQHKRQIKIVDNVKKLKCSKCNYWLVFDEFNNCSATSTGKKSCCKSCMKSKYSSKRRKLDFNSSMIGYYQFKCEYCENEFLTKKSNKIYCHDKCRKRAWYEVNKNVK